MLHITSQKIAPFPFNLAAGEERPLPASGNLVFCYQADGDFSLAIDEGDFLPFRSGMRVSVPHGSSYDKINLRNDGTKPIKGILLLGYGSLSDYGRGALPVKGDKGDTGASAYEIAVVNGFVGSEAEWLASLCGAEGLKGDKGDVGPAGSMKLVTVNTTDSGGMGMIDWVRKVQDNNDSVFLFLPPDAPATACACVLPQSGVVFPIMSNRRFTITIINGTAAWGGSNVVNLIPKDAVTGVRAFARNSVTELPAGAFVKFVYWQAKNPVTNTWGTGVYAEACSQF